MPTPKVHWYQGLQSALVAKWAIISAVLSDKLGDAFVQGAFATPQASVAYLHTNWWQLGVTAIFATVVGGVVRGGTKNNYINRVEAGNQPPPAVPVILPQAATVVKPSGG
jgi:hypothetical protein